MSSAPSPRATPSTPSPRGSWTSPTPPGSGPPSGSSGGSLPRTPSTPLGSFPSPPSSSSGTVVPVVITLGGVVLLVILPFVCYLWRERCRRDDGAARQGPKAGGPSGRQHRKVSRPSDHVVTPLPPKPNSNLPSSSAPAPLELGSSARAFTYEELATATNRFSKDNFLGEGGFGPVHKGELYGTEVAVKQLKAGSSQGETEFKTEVNTISRVHHRHLVSLVGYCVAGARRLLVYEFVPNNNLKVLLHERPTMEWSTRVKIALGSAKGLSYLHEDCIHKIIHRDIKAANILMNFEFEAKVADFGLAKIASHTNTHVSTRVKGTPGYVDPEYASSGKLTEKSDVYSFGVVLLELITGRKPVDPNDVDYNLVHWARPLLKGASEEGNFEDLADTKLNNEYNQEEMARMVACAAACVRKSAGERPTMSQIVRALEGNLSLSDLNEGIRPDQSKVYDTSQNEKLRKRAFGTQEHSASAENSNPTSDYIDCQTTPEMEMEKIKGNGPGFSGGPSI